MAAQLSVGGKSKVRLVPVKGLQASLAGAPASGGLLWVENFAAGATASFCTKLVLQPFDTTKTILQASRKVRGAYSNILDCMVGIVKTKGAHSLYRGLLASLTVSAPSSAVFFTAYEHIKKNVEKLGRNEKLRLGFLIPIAPAISSALGNCVSSIVRVPPEVLKQRVQAGQFNNIFEAFQGTWKLQGPEGFYTGYSAMVARDIPYAAVQFTTFEALKRRRAKKLEKRRLVEGSAGTNLTKAELMLSNLWMGAVSGAVASVLTCPIDVVKTRIMTHQAVHHGVQLGMRATFAKILAEEGLQAFGRGLLPRVMYKVPASALFLVCYEGMRVLLKSNRALAPTPILLAKGKKTSLQEPLLLPVAVQN